MRGLVAIVLVASLCGCGTQDPLKPAPREVSFAQLNRLGFEKGERQIVGLSAPSDMTDGATAEGSPIKGFSMVKGNEGYECRVPADQESKEDQSEAEMASWKCVEMKLG